MDSYQEIRVLPDPEFKESILMAALFAKLHRALAGRGKGDIGVCFPEYKQSPGSIIRLHGEQAALEELEATGWRAGLNDYCNASFVLPVPVIKGWRKVSRVQVKSSAERMLRRSVRKGWITEEEAHHRLSTMQDQYSKLPFIQMKSRSNGQAFRLFIDHGELQQQQSSGVFSSYGLSDGASIPWF
ncbi:type I-F CRISPR-associated endoribonuclease Cas6/Csy4 [Enterobacter sp. R1(2018)]|uniref:type I-F CRISPR-associated endoribonuclease Cas6/Csy4 n=1 Tax=Enterobacter sp. R1(2018) TaxID=2447891 RepID=UPI000EB3A6AA|nr:type I-F CRISPR-associated endoribonuclease Cas6/Csy4 [Enterobacter sp. R1(2018)]RKQ41020.1 type I-F CRISPR-associated endoribonuclease Cas6/Csy4 [Enterobacter sp. R1(2018)]